MKKTILSILTLAALTLTALTTPATASLVTAIDNTTLTTDIGQNFYRYPRYVAFQTGSNSASINSLTFKFGLTAAGSSSGTFAAHLYAVDATNMPTGSPLASQTGMAYSLFGPGFTFDITYTGADIANLSSFIMLSGQKYALALDSENGNNTLYWGYKPGSTLSDYTTGDGYTVLATGYSQGGVWGENANRYMLKLETNSASAVPEPSTYALVSIGLVGLGYARKRMKKDEEIMAG